MNDEKKTLVVISNGKKITIPDPSKIIMAVRTTRRNQVQASMDINVKNINIIRKNVRRF